MMATFPLYPEELARLLGKSPEWVEMAHYELPCRMFDGKWCVEAKHVQSWLRARDASEARLRFGKIAMATFPLLPKDLAEELGVSLDWVENLRYSMPCARRVDGTAWWVSDEAQLVVWRRYADVWKHPPVVPTAV